MHTLRVLRAVTVRVTTLKGPDAGAYYVEVLGRYWLEGAEAPATWAGVGAEALGLGHGVDDEDFLALLAGLDPRSGEALGRRFGDDSVRGFDVTASAPKSVSVLWALGDAPTRAAVLQAHDAAVGAMVGWIEDHAHTRHRRGGRVITVDASGIVAACVPEHTSRALDPQLHTHVVVANRVMAPDGRWLALDARTLKWDQRSLSALYHAGLRAELTRRLGVAWEQPANGIAELVGVPQALREEFSSRTRAVTERVEEKLERFCDAMGRDPTPRERWRLEREAVLDSRPAKADADAASLGVEWAERARAVGWAPERLAEVVGPALAPRGLDAAAGEQATEAALESLAATQSTWRPAELVRELAAALPTTLALSAAEVVATAERLAEAVVAERLVDLSPPVPHGVPRRRDGRPITESVAERALTTPGILAEEERLLGWAERRLAAGGGPGALDPGAVAHLSGPQREVAAAVAGTAELVAVVGPAGTGKTTALAPAVEALRAEGRAVFGVAPSAAAAEVLGTEANLAADTLDKLLVEHRLPRPPDHRYDLPPGATVIVDEAAMVPTPALGELAELADQRGWRVVAVGDPLQFSAVGRGGMFAHLVEAHGAVELDRVRRFAQPWEREASLGLRRGEPDALALYDAHGRIHGGSRGRMERAVVEAWAAARDRGESVAVMAPTTEAAERLNRRAQRRRVRVGEIDPSGPSVAAGPYRLHPGDEVATRHNDRALRTDRGLMVKNRDRFVVRAVHPDGGLSVEGRSGSVHLPPAYVADHVELAYASTSHAAQGRTVQRSLLFLDGPSDTRGVYVPMSRGRLTNDAFVVLEDERSATDVLAEALGRDWIDEPAVARRARLAERPAAGSGGRVAHTLEPDELRALWERVAGIDRALLVADHRVGQLGERLERAGRREEELAGMLAEAEARAAEAREVLDLHDHPLRRRFHRDEIDQARQTHGRAGYTIERCRSELAEIAEELPQVRSELEEARAAAAERPTLERERHQAHRRLDVDLAARRSTLAAEQPAHLLDALGPRPQRGAEARAWDDAAARIDQHRQAFGIDDTASLLGPHQQEWERGAFALSQHQASRSWEALDRSLGRPPVLEAPALEHTLSL